jgi:hypothetical protein
VFESGCGEAGLDIRRRKKNRRIDKFAYETLGGFYSSPNIRVSK